MTLLERLDDLGAILTVAVLAWIGIYLLLPHRHGGVKPARIYAIGGILSAIAVLALAGLWRPEGDLLPKFFFYAFGLLAIGGGLLMITARDPVHSALWFAVVVLSSSGLFLLAGAQFLAAGTIIVYAGAIIVTFLFVIMLAQSQGQALYDRAARRPLAAALTGGLMLAGLLAAILTGRTTGDAPRGFQATDAPLQTATTMSITGRGAGDSRLALVIAKAVPETSRLPERGESGETPAHVAGLGGSLFTDHLVTVQVVGLLLFVALIGAVAIATPKAPIRPQATVADARSSQPAS